jgi:hypothetical protein
MFTLHTFGLFILLAGFIIGLGAVTVIDIHGFLARTSPYWTEATIRTHKITKPLIWIGIGFTIIGGSIFYYGTGLHAIQIFHLISVPLMIINGIFLSFKVSPFLLAQEKTDHATELLPQSLQHKILLSFIISIILWWGNLGALTIFLTS